MNKLRLLTVVSIGLLAVNIVLIWILFSHKPMPPRDGEDPRVIVIEKLGFDEHQSKKYDTYIMWHKSEMQESDRQIRELKNKLYSTLISEGQESVKDSLIYEISKVQIHIEQIHYKHFQDIKKLCKPEQQKAFDTLCNDLAKLFTHHPPKRKKE